MYIFICCKCSIKKAGVIEKLKAFFAMFMGLVEE